MNRSKLKARPVKSSRRARNQVPHSLEHIGGMDVKALLRRRGMYLKQRENQRLKQAAKPMAAAIIRNQKLKKDHKKQVPIPEPQKYASLTNDQAKDYWEKQIHNVEIIERHFEIAIKRFLTNKVLPLVLSKLDQIIDDKGGVKALKAVEKDVFDDSEETDLSNQAQLDLEPLLQNMAVISGQSANTLIGIKDPYIASAALRAKVASSVEKFVGSMLNTDQDHLTGIITDGIEQGESIQQIRSSITDDFSQYSTMQATRITRTEVLRASVQSSVDAFTQSGLVDGLQWLTAGADDECADYEGQVETLDSSGFYDPSDEFQDGDPPLHPNCRCVLIPVLIDSSPDAIQSSKKPDVTKVYKDRIKELEDQIDKRTKAFKIIKAERIKERANDKAYVKALEKYLSIEDE